jgi:DNA-binding transcriptional LysR family regulator
MDLRQLKSLIAVSEEKTFIGAARRLHLAQPALSRQIRTFEREIGTAVFHRGRAGVTLTPAGEICVKAARSILDKVEAAVRETRMASAGRLGSCTIYASQWAVWSGFTGKLLAHLAALDPGIDVIVKEGQMGEQWKCLRENHVDIAIATAPPSGYEDIHSETLLEDVADIALLSPRHPLASRSSIRLEELAGEVLLTYQSNLQSTIERHLDEAFKRSRFVPRKMLKLPTTESLIARISAGMGWSIHRRALKGRIRDIATVTIEDFGFPVPVTLMHRANESQPQILEVARRIRELAAMEYPQMRPPGAYENTFEYPAATVPVEGLVEIRDLRYFAAVVEERGIGRAALRLGLTQPALSRQIRSVERSVGVSLVARATRGIIPTTAGKRLYNAARDILEEVALLPAEVERGQRAAAGQCMIAAIQSGTARDLLSSTMRTAGERFAHLELSVHNIPTPRQPRAIHTGEIDIGICHPFFNLTEGYSDLELRELLTDEIDGALLPRSHPLAAQTTIGFDDLASVPFIFFHREFHPAFHDYLLDVFRRLGYIPRMGQLQDGLQTQWSLCEAGAGWCLSFASHRNDPPPGLVSIPIDNFRIPWGLNILSRKNETRPAARAVIDILFEEASQRNREEAFQSLDTLPVFVPG